MNNKNNGIHFIKDDPPSPSEETTCDSTVNTTNTQSLTEQRRQLQQQVLHLGLASGATVAILIVTVIPLPILMALSFLLACLLSLLFKLYQRAQLEYQSILTGRGIGDYLPTDVYDQLVNQSFHDWMLNGTFGQEYQHFLLYFIPGITSEQLTEYVNRLIPRHRRALLRPGLGNALGPQFMQFVMGEERLADRQGRLEGDPSSRVVPRRLELQTRVDESTEDAPSELGDDDMGAQYAAFWGATPVSSNQTPARTAPARTSRVVIEVDPSIASYKTDDEEEDEEEEVEDLAIDESVLWEAVFGGVNAYSNIALDAVRGTVTSSMTMFTGTLLRTTLGMGALTLGAGLLGIWTGYLGPQDLPIWMPRFQLPRNFSRPSMPSSSILISSTLASGATASLFMMFGWSGSNESKKTKGQSKR
jgi:hypothetical protein